MNTVRVMIIGVLVILAVSGCAGESTEYSRPGAYVGASLIGAVPNFTDVGNADLGDTEFTGGIGGRLGWRCLDHVAVEAGYEKFADFNMNNNADVELENFLLTGKFYMLTGPLQPYGLLGVAYQMSEVDAANFDEKDPAARLGLGLEWYLIDVLPLFLELDYRAPFGDSHDLQYATVQLGLAFRF